MSALVSMPRRTPPAVSREELERLTRKLILLSNALGDLSTEVESLELIRKEVKSERNALLVDLANGAELK